VYNPGAEITLEFPECQLDIHLERIFVRAKKVVAFIRTARALSSNFHGRSDGDGGDSVHDDSQSFGALRCPALAPSPSDVSDAASIG
jgi:hypothetical protein